LCATPSQKRWRCSFCDRTIDPNKKGNSESNDPEKRLSDEQKRSSRNCQSDTNPSFYLDWLPALRRCPKAIVSRATWRVIDFWLDWKNYGILPRGKRIEDLPNYLVEALKICEQERIKIEQEQIKAI